MLKFLWGALGCAVEDEAALPADGWKLTVGVTNDATLPSTCICCCSCGLQSSCASVSVCVWVCVAIAAAVKRDENKQMQ